MRRGTLTAVTTGAIVACATGCVVVGPGTRAKPHLVHRLDGVRSLSVEPNAVEVEVWADQSGLVWDGSAEWARRVVPVGERFGAVGYIVKYDYELLEVKDDVAILRWHGRRTPDAVLISFVVPPPTVHEFDMVAVSEYSDSQIEGADAGASATSARERWGK
jgi:hypothetical protein